MTDAPRQRFVVYVLSDSVSPHVASETRAVVEHRNAHETRAHVRYRHCAAGALLKLLRRGALRTIAADYEFVLVCGEHTDFETAFTRALRQRARAIGAVRLANVVAEARQYSSTAASSVLAMPDDAELANSGAWLPRTVALLRAAPADGKVRVVLLAGPAGVGKTEAVGRIAAQLGLAGDDVLRYSPLAADNERAALETLGDAIEGRASRPRFLLALDDTDTARVSYDAFWTRAAPHLRRAAVLMIANDPYATCSALRSARANRHKAVVFVRVDAPPVPLAVVERVLTQRVPAASPALRRAIADEADGDVRAALLRTEFATRGTDSSGAFSAAEAPAAAPRESPAARVQRFVRSAHAEPGRQSALDLCGRAERELAPTLDDGERASSLLHANAVRMLDRRGDEAEQLRAAAEALDMLSLADVAMTGARRSGFAGDDGDSTLRKLYGAALGVALPASALARCARGQPRERYMPMDFGASTAARQARAHQGARDALVSAGATARQQRGAALPREERHGALPSGVADTFADADDMTRIQLLAADPVAAADAGLTAAEYGACARYADTLGGVASPRTAIAAEREYRAANRGRAAQRVDPEQPLPARVSKAKPRAAAGKRKQAPKSAPPEKRKVSIREMLV